MNGGISNGFRVVRMAEWVEAGDDDNKSAAAQISFGTSTNRTPRLVSIEFAKE